ncbi:putative potassium voltage-dependent transporter [Rosellinia necatrix]|uniref:Putative potassium voltage-dependent transporter n=1 Tax=Rosellinia necatrix TaxID=77044 RepID=A0A1W2TD57_ROSNE|nr:putative potassium voltage-dependent transporter [Rosellinia necatrix]
MQPTEREPRAALILNRFTRTLTIMFATNAVSSILGLGPDELRGRSLYEFIAENCWSDAVKCLERAKANDSIAYLRFWSRGPYVNDPEGDVEMEDRPDETSENDTGHGGVSPEDTLNPSACDGHDNTMKKEATSDPRAHRSMAMDEMSAQQGLSVTPIGHPRTATMRGQQARDHQPMGTRELEAVVSCTSDGLVMVLRKARPPIPSLCPPVFSPDFENGLFAAPWSEPLARHSYHPESLYAVQPPPLPRYTPVRGPVKAAGGPSSEHLMKSIRDVAVFAWGLTGINGKIASYGRGKPSGESQPPDGLPIWDPDSPKTSYLGPEPPSSKHRGNMSSKVHATKSASPMPPSHMPSPAVGEGHGLAQILGQFDNISPGHLNSPFPPYPSAVTHSPELRASPRVQQQYHGPMAGHRGSTPRARWVGAAWAETSASYSRREAITTQISTTQDHSFGGSFRDPPRMQS